MAYLEILIGAVAAFLLGFAWYTVLFGKAWQAETGITDDQAKAGVAMTHGLAFVMMAVLAYSVNMMIGYHDLAEQTFTHGAFHGMLMALTVGLPAVAINYLYQKKSLKLFLIDGGYLVAFMVLMGGVMAALKF
ncbi:MAG: DUF1761 domain-containing protein [Saprospiraceae bacterium]|nr:DUF1761 domain-containing protein [Saprospiraceae bacterium]